MLKILRLSVILVWMIPLVAHAKTVRTDTILVSPEAEAGSTITIPSEELLETETEEFEKAPLPDRAAEPLPAPEVLYDLSLLPKPVQRMHSQLKEAAQTGDVERLRMVLESNEVLPTLSLTEIGDPIDFLKDSSGDGEGLEILAILIDVLEAGFVHTDAGTAQEMYVWPYFARYPLNDLRPDQKVEMYRIITSADFNEMQNYGVWLFYRVGIGKDGTLHYFVAGE
ncbi:hypothetical protein JM93_02265 [Roseibium hamelinense]|uniref:Uncharacterized protein n=1 Tax=Roseibium hamelinense TaxID=150831 RepID=A0A562T3Q9_9HYPH|nr:hypothetical protein [Roseibium hamelinense]MTI42283.1 hypothetical protein [Roseibium hamelinense]TWI87696.1 hypothetical protein JM93_02265 [Roseibium hamelinense]